MRASDEPVKLAAARVLTAIDWSLMRVRKTFSLLADQPSRGTKMSAPRRRRFTWMAALIAAFVALVGLALPAAAQAAGTPGSPTAGPTASPPGGDQLQPTPTLPVNICQNSAL